MAFTYSGDPSNSDRDKLRFLIGDTVEASALYQDEELDYLLGQHASVEDAAVAALELAARRFAQEADLAIGDLRISASQRAEAYRKQALDLRGSLVGRGGMWAGGRSIAAKESRKDDTDAVQPRFERGMDDYPGAGLD